MHARGARGREEGPEVGLGHIDTVFQFTGTLGECPRAPLGLRPHLPVLTGFFPRCLQLGAELGNLLAQLNEPIHRRSAEVRVRETTTTSRAGVLLLLAGAPAFAVDRLSLPFGDGRSVQETVGATGGLQSAPRDKGPHCTSDRQWIGEAQFPAKLRRRSFQ